MTPLDPHSVRVEWQTPLQLNGRLADIRYVIMYRVQQSAADVTSKDVIKSVTVRGNMASGSGADDVSDADRFYQWVVGDLLDDTEYLFQVLILKQC